MTQKLLNEGGSGGHMFHPFNLPSINTGKDLIEFFYKAADFVSRNPEEVIPSDSTSLKVDGANTAFKLVKGPTGLEFAFDRGTMIPIDIEGITIDKLGDPDAGTANKHKEGRWPAGHGMISMGRIQLGALNRALPKIKNELIALGMLDKKGNPDPTKFINAEFCWKETNAVKYREDFIALHGLNQYYEKDYKGVHRPGAIRPLERDEKTGKMKPVKTAGTEVPYDEMAMESLRQKLLPFFRDAVGPKNPEGFNVYTVIPVSLKPDGDLASKVEAKLEEQLTIQLRPLELHEWNLDDATGAVTMSIRDWLSDERARNPRSYFVTMADGSKKGAMSKEVYGRILNGDPVESMVADPDGWDVPMAINGALFYYAIENVGATILEALTSPLGDMVTDEMTHEGIVLRNEELFGVKMVKITGNFITAGSAGKFAQVRSPAEEETEPEQADPEGDVDSQLPLESMKIAMFPGAFKPPHRGHLNMVSRLAAVQGIDEVLVIVSAPLENSREMPGGRSINAEQGKLIWQHYIAGSGLESKVRILSADSPDAGRAASPVQVVYDYVMRDPDPDNSFVAPIGAEVYLGCGDKGNDSLRYAGIIKKAREDIKVKVVVCPLDVQHSKDYMSLLAANPDLNNNMPSVKSEKNPKDFHASDMRFLAAMAENSPVAWELFKDFVPRGDALSVMGTLGLNPVNDQVVEEPGDINSADDLMEFVSGFLNEKLLQEDFQTKMKKRLAKAHAWFLDQGRHDLTKYGGGFHLPRPKNKSNAFLAKESKIRIRINNKIKEMSTMSGGHVEVGASGNRKPKKDCDEADKEKLIR